MSISIEKRRADALRVLNAFFMALGDDHRVYEVSHSCNEEPLASAYETTLTTLKEKGLIEVVTQGPTFSLTPYGWQYYVEKYGSAELHEQFERRRFQLAAAMKSFVKGRSQDAFVMIHELVEAAKLPDGWVFNAIRSGWFEEHDREGRFPFAYDRGLIRVPAHFGQSADDVI